MISLVSAASNWGSDTSPTVTIPSDTVNEDDLILVWLMIAYNLAPTSEPGGYTAICDPISESTYERRWSRAYYKVAAGGEEDDAISFSQSGVRYWFAGVAVFRGVDAADPFDVTPNHASHHLEGEDDTTPTLASLTTATDGACVVEICSNNGATDAPSDITTNDGGATQLWKELESRVATLATYVIEGSAGLHGGSTFTYADVASTKGDWTSITIAFKPEGAASPTTYTKSVGLDAALQATETLSIGLDALLQGTSARTVGLDAALLKTLEETLALNAALQKTFVRLALLDAALLKTQTGTLAVDAALQDTFDLAVSLDARLAYGRQLHLDAALQATLPVNLGVDARLAYGRHVGLDAYLMAPTFVQDADRHRLKGDKDTGGEYGSTTQTEITYLRGLNPGE